MATANEILYFHVLATGLNPSNYAVQQGTSWTLTVPAGKTYYALGATNVKYGAAGVRWDHLDARLENAVVLPEATDIRSNGGTDSLLYYWDPSLETLSNPVDKYFERVMRLEALTSHTLGVSGGLAAALGTEISATFPADFTEGLVIQASNDDLGWGRLDHSTNTAGVIWNNHISDDHQFRFGGGVMIPFTRTTFPGIRARVGSITGEVSGFSGLDGAVVVTYFKLPGDW